MNGTRSVQSHTNYTYDSNGVRILTLTDALGHVTSRVYDPAFDRLTSENDYLGNVTAFPVRSLRQTRHRYESCRQSDGHHLCIVRTKKPSLAVYGVTQSGNDGWMATTWNTYSGGPFDQRKKDLADR